MSQQSQYPQQPQQGRGMAGIPQPQQGRGQQGRVGQQPQQPPQQAQYGMGPRGGPGRPMGAWQPAAPTSLQQAAAGHPGQYGRAGYGHHQYYHNPYAAAQQSYAAARSGWQQSTYPTQGSVYYPSQQAPAVQPQPLPHQQAVAPRKKKPLVITDKDGNVVDFSKKVTKPEETVTLTVDNTVPAVTPSEPDAGSKLRQAALERLREPSEQVKKKEEPTEPLPPPEPEPEPKIEPKPEKEITEEKINGDSAEPSTESSEQQDKEKSDTPTDEKTQMKSKSSLEMMLEKENGKTTETHSSISVKSKDNAEESTNGSRKTSSELPLGNIESSAPTPTPTQRSSVGGGLRPGGRSKMQLTPPSVAKIGAEFQKVYSKEILLRLKNLDVCKCRPENLPDMTITRGPSQRGQGGGSRRDRGGGDGRGGGSNWERGAQQPRNRRDSGGGGGRDEWKRGQAPPKQQNNNRRGRHMNNQPPPLEDVAPLVKSENRWRPKKNTSRIIVVEKKVKSILNKMTKEKFDKLSAEMCAMPIFSYEMLTVMIHNVYEKAIDEPAFGDMYADLCVRLSKGAAAANNNFVKIIESDEEPPTENTVAASEGESSSHTVYRWSNDVSTADAEIVGPFDSPDSCVKVALDQSETVTPIERGEMELDLHKVLIKKNKFIKIMKKSKSKDDTDSGDEVYYVVYFPMSDAEDCGQQLSEVFLAEIECKSNAKKMNSFKRSLLNKCEDEFKKKDIYEDWKKEKEEYEKKKASLTPLERREQEEDFVFRRTKIKKQMLGNIKFIGQLYKKGLLKEKIMRFCIGALLRMEETKNGFEDQGTDDMDEEDHEAICSMFTTIGSTIDKLPAADFMKFCFNKINMLCNDKSLPSRSRFMYKDLLDLRQNYWVPRRKEEKAKTLDEIRKEVEREERMQAQQSQAYNQRGGNNRDYRGGSNDYRNRSNAGSNRSNRQQKPIEKDDDGFTMISGGRSQKGGFSSSSNSSPKMSQSKLNASKKQSVKLLSKDRSSASVVSTAKATTTSKINSNTKAAPEALTPEKLTRRIKSIRDEFVQDPKNIDELLLSIDELKGTPNYGFEIVQKNGDRLFDCKESECKAIIEMLSILVQKGKLKGEDVKKGLMDSIEFIDSIQLDCPKAYDYMGNLLVVFMPTKEIDIPWFCEQCEKTKVDPGTMAPEKLVKSTLAGFKTRYGIDAAKQYFSSTAQAMLSDLVGKDKFLEIFNEFSD